MQFKTLLKLKLLLYNLNNQLNKNLFNLLNKEIIMDLKALLEEFVSDAKADIHKFIDFVEGKKKQQENSIAPEASAPSAENTSQTSSGNT